MKKDLSYAYKSALEEILEGIDDLMADLEDIRDEAQELLDENAHPSIKADVEKMDEALRILDQAAECLSKDL